MRYTDLILKDFPIAVWPLDETITGTSNFPCYSITDNSASQSMQGQYVYNSGWKAVNSGLPLVLGGEDSTFLISNSGQPSLKIPRLNCFSSNSLYTDSTLEFWIKIEKSSGNEVKIMGVDDSGLESFGLYSYKNYLLFKLNDESFISAPVQTWNVQHHVAITYSYSGIAMIVDGVKYYPLKRIRPDLPFQNNKNFVFYGSSELGSVAVDAIAIYKYGLTEQNCRRHMVYALGFSFSGVPFTRNNGVFSTFENINSKKIDDFIIPTNPSTINFESENVILSDNGIQLFNNDKIFYVNNTLNTQDFYFSDQSYLKIEDVTNYFQDNFGLGLSFTIDSTIPTDEEQTILFLDGSENSGDLQVLLLNGNAYLRIYSIDKTGATPPYYEKNLGAISPSVENLFSLSMSGSQYSIYINDSLTSYDDLPTISLQESSSLYLGALAQLSDTEQFDSFFSNGHISRVTLFKNIDEFSSVINSTAGNITRFNQYYQNFTIEFDKRVRLYRKGSIGINVGMDQFGKPMWDGTISRSSCGAIKIEHLYPKTEDSEILITINQYDPPATTAAYTQIIQDQIEMLGDVDHEVDLTDRWMSIDVDFDATDCYYFPPVLGQITFSSMATTVSSAEAPDFDVELQYLNFEGTVKLQAQDNKPYLEEFMISAIALGEFSGINISGDCMVYNHTYSSGSNESLDNRGIKSLGMFIKRNNSDLSKEVFSWVPVTGTTLPSSASVYIDGQFYQTISLSGKQNILWSDISVDENIWRYLLIVFNTPIIYKNSTKQGPVLKFGNSSGNSNVSIQHLGICENELSSEQIGQIYKIFSGENKISASSTQDFSIYETANGVQIYQNNWQRMS